VERGASASLLQQETLGVRDINHGGYNMTFYIRNKSDHTRFLDLQGQWVELADARMYGPTSKYGVTIPDEGEWVTAARARAGLKKMFKAKENATKAFPFYEQVEKFISAHDGSDTPSKELENLCSRLSAADPTYCDTMSQRGRHTFVDVLNFAYRLLQVQRN
jgi:hypothetical protein